MKKMRLLLFTGILAAVLFIADWPSAKAEENKTFVGTIKSFPHGFQFRSGPPLWPFGKIEVAADNGQINNFLIVGSGSRATIFYDLDGKSLGTVTADLSKGELAKKVEIGRKVEVIYTTPPEAEKFIVKDLAISVRYVPADYAQRPDAQVVTAQSAQAVASQPENIFVGKIEKSAPAFKYWWAFTAVADNGEKREFRVPRGGSIIIQINGKQRYGEAPRKGRKIEVRYSVDKDGYNVTTSMRYVPLDYVPQPAALTTPTNAASETAQLPAHVISQTGNTFTGKVVSVTKCLPRPPYWRVAILAVVTDSGENKEMDTVNDTSVSDALGKEKGKSRSVWSLKNGQRIEVNYLAGANNGHDKVIAIRCLD